MTSPEIILKEKKQEVLALTERYGVENIRVFGSAARGEADEKSDLDLLVSVRKGTSLWELIELEDALTSLLKVKVDLVSDKGVSPYLKDRIFQEAKPL